MPHPMAYCSFTRSLRTWALLLMAVLFGFAGKSAWAQRTESAEVAVHPASVEVAGQSLQRNGAGVRYKAIFQVYSAALYLEQKAKTLEAISQLNGPKRVSVRMLRTINASELGKLFAHGMEDNMDRQQFSKLIPGVMRMSEVFNRHKELKTGDTFTLDWIPSKGMVISVNGVPEPTEFAEPQFYHAMLGIWLGPKPADSRLKQSLLDSALN